MNRGRYLLALNFFRRDWRAGEWRVLMLALVLAVGSLSTVGLFADRVRQALSLQAASLLGADLRISSTRPFSPEYRKLAEKLGLRVVENRTFPSMVSHQDQVTLAEIQSVPAGYPLRGKIDINDGITHVATGIPHAGSVWVDERLMRRFDLHVGDELGVGQQRFVVAARIVKDIDQSVGFASFSSRVLMNEVDVAGTGLLQEGSRIAYRLMIAGEPAPISALRIALKGMLSSGEKLEDVTDARPEIRTALERAEQFLGLAALTTALLAGVAVMLAARRYVLRHLDACAVMRCLGITQSALLQLFLYQFLIAGFIAVLGGLLSGYLVQAALVEWVMRATDLPQPGFLPAIKAALSGFALLFGFAFLPLLQLRRISPLRVIRRELGLPGVSAWLVYGIAALVLASLFLWQAGSLKLGLFVLAGLLVGLLMAWCVVWLWLRVLAYAAVRFSWPHSLRKLANSSVAVQVVALSLGGMALLVLTLVRGDLLQSWQGKLPFDAPNRFVVGIQSEQRQSLQEFFRQQAVSVPELLPMVKGRLVAVNGQAISAGSFADPRAKGLVEREFNLSYAQKMPVWNTLVQGRWWNESHTPASPSRGNEDNNAELSVEEGIAKTLNIHLGDQLTYDVAGSLFSAPVTSLRRVQWDSMRVNFFVIATPVLLQDYPASYLASFYLPPDKVLAGDALSRQFPNMLLIDIREVIEQVRGIIAQVSQTVSVVFVYTLLSGLLVLYAALLATQDERIHEAAVLRVLGADSAYLRRLYLSEFAVIGLLAGLLASLAAVALGWVLARYVLDIPYRLNSIIWLSGVSGGIVMVMLVGYFSTRRVAKIPPLRVLRGE
ncbi:MAG TPA: ABC transporter permease [Gallionella sp.]|nr:ABC transporter permease [Gallionella sp.]